jgi:hypothetical protein
MIYYIIIAGLFLAVSVFATACVYVHVYPPKPIPKKAAPLIPPVEPDPAISVVPRLEDGITNIYGCHPPCGPLESIVVPVYSAPIPEEGAIIIGPDSQCIKYDTESGTIKLDCEDVTESEKEDEDSK